VLQNNYDLFCNTPLYKDRIHTWSWINTQLPVCGLYMPLEDIGKHSCTLLSACLIWARIHRPGSRAAKSCVWFALLLSGPGFTAAKKLLSHGSRPTLPRSVFLEPGSFRRLLWSSVTSSHTHLPLSRRDGGPNSGQGTWRRRRWNALAWRQLGNCLVDTLRARPLPWLLPYANAAGEPILPRLRCERLPPMALMRPASEPPSFSGEVEREREAHRPPSTRDPSAAASVRARAPSPLARAGPALESGTRWLA
jgi:hypothetical protein